MTIRNLIVIYFIIVNVVALYMYWSDKRKAVKGKWRIPESTLLIVAMIGGSIGALLGMKLFRHKTKHWKFKILVPLFLILQVGLGIYLIIK